MELAAKLDQYGKPAWIVLMVLGFIVFWPVGLALLAYMYWSKGMFKAGCANGRMNRRHMRHGLKPTGNMAFDSYKSETLRRLEEEQEAFEAFLQRLREAKDKSEFDQFMQDRAQKAAAAQAEQRSPYQAPGQGPAQGPGPVTI